MSKELTLGICEGEELSISTQEQLAHTFIFANSNHTNSLLHEILVKKIESGEGIMLFQGAKTSLHDSLIDRVKSSYRRDDFVEIGDNDDFAEPRRIQDLLVTLIRSSKVVYVNFSGPNKLMLNRIFIQAFNGALDEIRTVHGARHNQFNLISTNIENLQSKHWLKIISFSRVCNIALFNTCGGVEAILKLRANLDPMYNVVEELFNASLNQIIFNQGDTDLNAELARITGIKKYYLTRNGVFKSNDNKKVLLDQLSGRMYTLLFDGSVNVLSY